MLNRFKFRTIIRTTLRIHGFNLAEYQDKYYFQKKIHELLPQLSEKDIYTVIVKLQKESVDTVNNNLVDLISDELYNIYLEKVG